MQDLPERAYPRSRLEELCAELFIDAEELRRWARQHYPAIAERLPGTVASELTLRFYFERLLEQYGLVEVVTAELTSLRDRCQAEGRRRLDLEPPERGVWRRRYTRSRTVAAGCLVVLILTRAYPKWDLSQAMLGVELSVFRFLPTSYQRSGILALTILAWGLTVVFGVAIYASRRRR